MIAQMVRALRPKRPKLPEPEPVDFVARMREARAYGIEQTRASHKETRRMTKQSVIERTIVGGHRREDTHEK